MQSLNALVIDPNEQMNGTLCGVLKKVGFNVELLSTGYDALTRVNQTQFSLICCNNDLPDLSGSDFCGQLRAMPNYEFCSVLILSEQSDARILKQGLLAGATDIFPKSELADLEAYLHQFMARETRELIGRVLLIEDSRVLQAIILDMLTDMGLDVDAFTRAEDAWGAFQQGGYDLVITDVLLEGIMSGITLVRKIRRFEEGAINVPIIATSGFENKSRRVELFHLGVNDFISKPIVREELRQRVMNQVTSYQSLKELKFQQSSLYSLAMLDELTQLFNRHALREFGEKYFSEAYRFKRPLSMAVLDVDYLKKINEQYGFDKGDLILAELAKWLKRCVRDVDLVARWAGDEFVFLIRECDEEGAKILMERLLARIKQFKPLDIPVTVSIGISTAVPSDETKHTLNSLFEQADSAMYKAKMAGRNGISIYQKDEG
jgi:two-component system cell cycle response regulator